jgi:drug/metabolite transporter (DMT)-like permease
VTYLNPAIAVLLGVAILGEPLTAGLLIGFPIILGGSVLASLRTTHVAPEAS